MKTKHLNKFVIIGLFSFILLMSVAFAQSYGTAFQPFFDLLEYIFNDLGQNIIFRKFLIWMFLFTILTILVQRLPFLKQEDATQSKQAKIIAFVLSLIMAIGIPNAMINLIYDEYSLVAALALYLLVPILIFIATKDMENQVVRGIVFIIMGVLLGIFTANASSGSWGTQLRDLIGWLYTASAICLIAGIIMIVSGLGTIGGGSGGTRGGDGGNNNNNNNNPRQPNNPPQNNQQIVAQLGAFTQNLQNFGAAITAFDNYVRALPGGVILPLQERNQILNLSNNVITASNALSQNIANINSQPQLFQTLSQQQQQQFTQGVNQYLALYNQHMINLAQVTTRF